VFAPGARFVWRGFGLLDTMNALAERRPGNPGGLAKIPVTERRPNDGDNER
jgi:hypothetical protein